MSSPPDAEQLRLTTADFDAYLPERATSNAFTRPRLELKQRMLAWARGVVTRLGELAIPVDVTGSDEHPSLRNGRRVDWQRVFFWRDADARAEIERLIDRKRSLAAALGDAAPHQSHAYLALRVDSAKVEVSFELHPDAWVDWKNARARLGDPGRTLELTSAIEALPEQFTIGLSIDEGRAAAPRATSDSIRALLDRAEQEQRAIWIGWTIPREVAIPNSEVLDDQLEDAIVALGPIHKLLAWAPDNDLFDLAREVRAEQAEDAEKAGERSRSHEPATPRDRAWQAKRDRGDDARARIAERETRPSVEPKEPEPEPSAPRPPSRPPAMPRMMMRRGGNVTEVDPTAPIEKGTRVQVLAGPFRGKVGVVQELDGKEARVMLGLLATRIDVKNLIAAAEGKDRPALATSHRKPIGVRS